MALGCVRLVVADAQGVGGVGAVERAGVALERVPVDGADGAVEVLGAGRVCLTK